jgi:hypothetical protein
MKLLAAKLLEVQKEIGTLSKGAVNPFFKSKYIDINGVLEVLTPALQARGILLSQPLSSVMGQPAIKTLLIDTDSGEELESIAVIPAVNDPQKAGGCITYFRRYSLISLMGFGAEDDDANAASGKGKKAVAPKAAVKKKVTARVDSF